MGDILVKGATVSNGKIEKLRVDLHGLPERVIDRDTAIAWLKDGHSFIPVVRGSRQTALQLVELADKEGAYAIRTDNASGDDLVGDLPSA